MLVTVMTKNIKILGTTYLTTETDYKINFNDDESITIFHKRLEKTTFKVGSTAIFDPGSLYYSGVITKITNKTITIIEHYGRKTIEKTHRLGLHKFCQYNESYTSKNN